MSRWNWLWKNSKRNDQPVMKKCLLCGKAGRHLQRGILAASEQKWSLKVYDELGALWEHGNGWAGNHHLSVWLIPNPLSTIMYLHPSFRQALRHHSSSTFPEAEFLDVIGTKGLWVFIFAIQSHLYFRFYSPPPPPEQKVVLTGL